MIRDSDVLNVGSGNDIMLGGSGHRYDNGSFLIHKLDVNQEHVKITR